MEQFYDLFYIIAGFFLLVYGASKLVDGASSLALRLNVPAIVVGLTIVAFGTSAPELVVNAQASVRDQPEIVIGNILGSNIFNILVILGITSLFFPLGVKTNTTWIEVPLTILASLIILILAADVFLDGQETDFIGRSDGLILLAFFLIFLVYTRHLMKGGEYPEGIPQKQLPVLRTIIYILMGLAMLIIGGRLIVDSAENLALAAGVSERVISLTIISIGTSLPELATSVVAARKRNVDLAIGNIVGSNIFNIFLILGISASIAPIRISFMNILDMGVNLLATLMLFLFIFTGKGRRIEKWEGIIMLMVYAGYLGYLLYS